MAVYLGFYLPKVRFVERTKEEIVQENLRLNQLKGRIEEYERLRRESEEIKEKLAHYERLHLFYSEDQVHSLLQDLGIRGRTYGITYAKIVPGKVVRGSYYDCIPMRIRLYSTYHALGGLLSDIAERQEVTSLSIESIQPTKIQSGEENLRGRHNTIEVDLTLFIYTAKSGNGLETSSASSLSEKKDEAKLSRVEVVQRRRR